MLMIGCDGGTHASSNAVPEVTRRIYDLARAGNYDEAMKWQYRILELFDVMLYPFEFPDGFRAAAELRGFGSAADASRRPAAQQTDRTALTWVLHCILADFELVEPPAAGCAPRTGSLNGTSGAGCLVKSIRSSAEAGISDRMRWPWSRSAAGRPAMVVLDAMEKAAGVRILQTELNDSPGVCMKLAGALGDVQSARRRRGTDRAKHAHAGDRACDRVARGGFAASHRSARRLQSAH